MIKEAILKVYKHEDLTYEEAYETMDEIMSGKASEVQMSAYLTAMSMKGETIEEITASAEAMRAHCVRLLNDEEVLEIVGTGGDGSNTFNISTTSSGVNDSESGVNPRISTNRHAISVLLPPRFILSTPSVKILSTTCGATYLLNVFSIFFFSISVCMYTTAKIITYPSATKIGR